MREIEQNASRWRNYECNESYLLTGLALAQAEKIYLEYVDELSLKTREYIQDSLQLRVGLHGGHGSVLLVVVGVVANLDGGDGAEMLPRHGLDGLSRAEYGGCAGFV